MARISFFLAFSLSDSSLAFPFTPYTTVAVAELEIEAESLRVFSGPEPQVEAEEALLRVDLVGVLVEVVDGSEREAS